LARKPRASRTIQIGLKDTIDLAACAGLIHASTLVVAGERDRFYPIELWEETVSLIPDARPVVESGRGHMTATGPAAVRETILNHLEPR
jgi:pimeloyl-ACP methyl ester carboxylesterase